MPTTSPRKDWSRRDRNLTNRPSGMPMALRVLFGAILGAFVGAFALGLTLYIYGVVVWIPTVAPYNQSYDLAALRIGAILVGVAGGMLGLIVGALYPVVASYRRTHSSATHHPPKPTDT